MNKEYTDKQVTERMQKLWDSKITPLVEQLNAELTRAHIAMENAEKIKAEITKTHKELVQTANQLAEAFSAAPALVETQPAKK